MVVGFEGADGGDDDGGADGSCSSDEGVNVGRDAAIITHLSIKKIDIPTRRRFSSASLATRSFSFRFSSFNCLARAFARSLADIVAAYEE